MTTFTKHLFNTNKQDSLKKARRDKVFQSKLRGIRKPTAVVRSVNGNGNGNKKSRKKLCTPKDVFVQACWLRAWLVYFVLFCWFFSFGFFQRSY